jgi:predicted metal-dependent hydrolase
MVERPAGQITIDGVELALVVTRKRVKNINARLRGATLSVSVPLSATPATLERAIPELGRVLLRRARARKVNNEHDALALAGKVATRFPVALAIERAEFVTTQLAQWGSYSAATRTIRLHAALRAMPPWVLEAVIAHELAHAVHCNHSPSFWALLRRVCPETDRARAFLGGVSWLAGSWEVLPPVERALLTRTTSYEEPE